ncbi:MAG: GtrA family protein [Patescibacteria group bacterium]
MDNIQAVQPLPTTNKITLLLEKYPVLLQLIRFGAIGLFNTTIDVLVLNYMATQFGVTKGASLGWVNLPGFILAVTQSYFWNKYWAFSGENVNLVKNFFRLALVGVVGLVIYALVFVGGHNSAPPIYFLGILTVFIIAQLVLWYSFGFFKQQALADKKDYVAFFAVSVTGFLINSLVLYGASTFFVLSTNSGDNLNYAKILATVGSLAWNFIGYKLFVFKK